MHTKTLSALLLIAKRTVKSGVNGGYLSISDSMVGEVWDNGRVSRLMDTAGNDANVQTTAILVISPPGGKTE